MNLMKKKDHFKGSGLYSYDFIHYLFLACNAH